MVGWAATLAASTFRVLMVIAASYDLEAYQLDAVNAFINSKLDETVYCGCLLLLLPVRPTPLAIFGSRNSQLRCGS